MVRLSSAVTYSHAPQVGSATAVVKGAYRVSALEGPTWAYWRRVATEAWAVASMEPLSAAQAPIGS